MNLNTLEEVSEIEAESFFKELRSVLKQESIFTVWFKNTSLSLGKTGKPVLLVPNTFSRHWILKKYSKELSTISNKIWGCELQCEIGVFENLAPNPLKSPSDSEYQQPQLFSEPVKRFDSHTFDEYEAGSENQLAYYAAKNLSRDDLYNSPFSIVGEHGMGKTHLASAIVHGMKKSEVAFMHAEEFTNAYGNACKIKDAASFRISLRSKKVLVIEDLDFFLEGNKIKTIVELIQTIRIFKREKCQIVITSTRALHEYETISPQLVNLLLSGLKVRLLGPSEQTRKKIINSYLKSKKIHLSKKCISFVESIKFENHRELLGALTQLVAFSGLEKEGLSLHVVKEILSDHLCNAVGLGKQAEGILDLHSIGQCVSNKYGVSLQKLISPSRERHISEARHLAMNISYEEHYTLNEIGAFYGGRLHQSVLYSVRKIQNKRQENLDFNKLYNKLTSELKNTNK